MKPQDLVTTSPAALEQIGSPANHYAARSAFADYQSRLDPNTLTRQQDDLAHYGLYLEDAGVSVSAEALFSDPARWAGTTHGLIKGFVQWMLLDGYSDFDSYICCHSPETVNQKNQPSGKKVLIIIGSH